MYSVDKWLVGHQNYDDTDIQSKKDHPLFINGTIVQDGVVIDDGHSVVVKPISISGLGLDLNPFPTHWLFACLVFLLLVLTKRIWRKLWQLFVKFACKMWKNQKGY